MGVVRPWRNSQGCPGQTPPDLPASAMRARAPSCRQIPGSLVCGGKRKVPGVARTSPEDSTVTSGHLVPVRQSHRLLRIEESSAERSTLVCPLILLSSVWPPCPPFSFCFQFAGHGDKVSEKKE